ncbi:unnamed protein product, partial [Mycena citricolor]
MENNALCNGPFIPHHLPVRQRRENVLGQKKPLLHVSADRRSVVPVFFLMIVCLHLRHSRVQDAQCIQILDPPVGHINGPVKHPVDPIPICKTILRIFADKSSGGVGESTLHFSRDHRRSEHACVGYRFE